MERLDRLCTDTIRMLAVDAIEKARSGHPGLPMGTAALNYLLWTKFLRHNPENPAWPDRDRFVLSAGHGSMVLYALLHLSGYDLSLEDLKEFRQWGSKTPGHPEHGHTPGVETTTGPLGQGLANAVGMAMAERFLAAEFNRPGHAIVDHCTYVVAGDGDLMEGVSYEAASLAGHLRLGRLICLYDDNRISIEGSTDLTFTEDRLGRFAAAGWQVLEVADGNDLAALSEAIREARADETRPSFIAVRTHIGFGSPGKQDKSAAHGEPLGAEEAVRTKENLGWTHPEFFVPDEVYVRFHEAAHRGRLQEEDWRERFASYAREYPEEAARWQDWLSGRLPEGWDSDLPAFPAGGKPVATRVASGQVLNALAQKIPNLIGGSADLAPSTKTLIAGSGDFTPSDYAGRNIRFGVREHAMGSLMNGMTLHGGVRVFGATFFVFSDYMRPAIRMAALMSLPVVYVFTHDSIGVGEDGPTHQPVEHLASLRAMPGLTVIRPADGAETAWAWRQALTSRGPVALVLSRQDLPLLEREGTAAGLLRGAYVLRDTPGQKPAAIILASGSEVHVAVAAATELMDRGIAVRVVSMPSWELFEQQDEAYRQAVLPPDVPVRVAVEAGSTQGWHRYVGLAGDVVGLDRFGASAPFKVLAEEFGFTPAAVAAKVLAVLEPVK
ncbi:MAG TPA: transketolase [Spirochaetia bacterium]|nr:transketolase [Spirochaetia bacterium]